MRGLTAGALATLAVPALVLMPSAAASAQTTPQPEGGGTGWTLQENDSGLEMWNAIQSPTGDWANFSGQGHQYCDNAGTVGYDSVLGAVTLTTDGTVNGNCARLDSTWTVAPSSTRAVWVEYEAQMPSDTWATMWLTGWPLDTWPTTGEIDVVEMLGYYDECHTYHYGTQADPEVLGPGLPGRCSNTGPIGAWQVYGVEWTPGLLKFYFDGSYLGEISSSVISDDPEIASVDNKTGSWDPAPGPSSTAYVGYVRAWYKTS
jgi:hypothetical protein